MPSLFIATLLSLFYGPVLGAPRLTVTTGEEFTVSLPSLLPGCNLEYSVTAREGLAAEVEDPNNLVLMETVPRRNVSDFVCAPLLIFHEGNEYVLSEDGNLLIATEIKAAGSVGKIWEFPIAAEGVIRGLEVQRLNGVHLLFVLFQIANSHTAVHTIELSDITIKPNSTAKLDLPVSEALASVLLSVAINFDQSLTLVLAGHSPQLETLGRNSLFLYKLSQKREVRFLSQIKDYSGMPLNIVSMFSTGVVVHMLDEALGLMTLEPTPLKLPTLKSRVDLSGYGTPISFRVPAERFKFTMIVTTVGLVVVDLQQYAVRPWLENLSLCDESWTLGDAEFSEQYLFTTGTTADDTFFQVTRTRSLTTSRSWRLSDFIPREMINLRSPVLFHSLIPHTRYHLIRSDKDALRVFKLELGTTELRARALSTGEFSAVVSGSQRFFPAPSAVETLAVEAISPTNSTILFGAGYSLDSVGSVQTYTRSGRSAAFSFNPQELFSGPDLRLSATLKNITEGATFAIRPIPATIIDMEVQESCAVSQTAQFAATLSVVLAIEDEGLVVIVDPMKKEDCKRVKVQGLKIVHICQGCADLIVLGELKSGDRLIARLDPQTYQPIETIGVTACDRIRPETSGIFCVSSTSITLFDSSLKFITTITAETLGLPALKAEDAALIFSVYSDMNYLYLSCSENGLLLVSLPRLDPPKLEKLLDAESGQLLAHSSYICRTTAAGETTVFDVTRAPAVRAVRTLPVWSPGAVTAVFAVQSYIWVEKAAVGYLLSVEVPVHSALVAVRNFAPGCTHVSNGFDLFEACQNDGLSTVSEKAVKIPATQNFSGGMGLIAEIDAKNAGSGLCRAVLEVKAENSFGASAQALVAFELVKE